MHLTEIAGKDFPLSKLSPVCCYRQKFGVFHITAAQVYIFASKNAVPCVVAV